MLPLGISLLKKINFHKTQEVLFLLNIVFTNIYTKKL